MDRLASLNLLSVLEVYLILSFILSIIRRYAYYRALLGFIVALPQRWPKLFQLTQQHHTIFLTWPTIMPVVVTFALMATNSIALNFVWLSASVTPVDLWHWWPALILVIGFGAPMLYLDVTAVFRPTPFDREALEKHLDQAEYWLRSWVAPALRVLTFGYVNPRQMVHDEVSKALVQATLDFNRMMWWWALQIAMRLAFGLTLWLTWALTPPLAAGPEEESAALVCPRYSTSSMTGGCLALGAVQSMVKMPLPAISRVREMYCEPRVCTPSPVTSTLVVGA